jgi:CBS domain containing-hemolysin-like protein
MLPIHLLRWCVVIQNMEYLLVCLRVFSVYNTFIVLFGEVTLKMYANQNNEEIT